MHGLVSGVLRMEKVIDSEGSIDAVIRRTISNGRVVYIFDHLFMVIKVIDLK